MSRKENEVMLESLIETIPEILVKGEEVRIAGLGTFGTRERESREMINPKTGKKVTVTAGNVPSFRAGKRLKEAVK